MHYVWWGDADLHLVVWKVYVFSYLHICNFIDTLII